MKSRDVQLKITAFNTHIIINSPQCFSPTLCVCVFQSPKHRNLLNTIHSKNKWEDIYCCL